MTSRELDWYYVYLVTFSEYGGSNVLLAEFTVHIFKGSRVGIGWFRPRACPAFLIDVKVAWKQLP
jgi:hypothetical protein